MMQFLSFPVSRCRRHEGTRASVLKSVFSLVLLLLAIQARSQQCVVAATRMNIVYVGIPNPVDIAVEGRDCQDFYVTTDNGKIEQETPCHYLVYPAEAGKITFSIFGKGGKRLQQLPFQARLMPLPQAMVAGKAGGTIRAAVLRVQMGVTATLNGFDFDASFKVTKFTVVIVRKEENIFTGSCNGNLFDEKIKTAFGTVLPGDRVLISDIGCVGPDRLTRALIPIEFQVID